MPADSGKLPIEMPMIGWKYYIANWAKQRKAVTFVIFPDRSLQLMAQKR